MNIEETPGYVMAMEYEKFAMHRKNNKVIDNEFLNERCSYKNCTVVLSEVESLYRCVFNNCSFRNNIIFKRLDNCYFVNCNFLECTIISLNNVKFYFGYIDYLKVYHDNYEDLLFETKRRYLRFLDFADTDKYLGI